MFKPKKDEPNKNKLVMPMEHGMPKSSVIRQQLDEATKKRGLVVEQAWTTSRPEQKYVLIVQWGDGVEKPIWTLYEENASQSKMHFSQPFEVKDFPIMYDVIAMNCPDQAEHVAIPDDLRPRAATPEREGAGSFRPGAMPGAAPPGYPPAPPATPYPGYSQPQYPPQQSPYPPQQPPYPPQQPAYPPQQPPYPPQQPPYSTQPPPYPAPGSPYAPPPPAPYAQPAAPETPSPWQPGYTPGAQPAVAGSEAAAASKALRSGDRLQPVDYNELLHKKANVLLGSLLFEAGLISEPTLEAALKVQEFVRDQRMSSGQASEILKKHHNMGSSIDQYLNPADFDINKPAASNKAKGDEQPESPQREKIKREIASFDLLQKADLLKEEDLKTAHGVHTKHGGDLVAILQAAGKLDITTYQAAETCVGLIKDGVMKFEQCIIALNFCSRSRVDFDTAMDELGWQNPRKAAK